MIQLSVCQENDIHLQVDHDVSLLFQVVCGDMAAQHNQVRYEQSAIE